MKYMIFFLFFIILLIIGCSTGIMYIYEYQPIVQLSGDTTEIVFRVPDLEPDGWWNGDGVDTIAFQLELKEIEGADAYITEINWDIVSISNNIIHNDKIMLIHPILLNKNDSILTLNIVLNEENALDLDEEDGIQDNVGTGVLILTAIFYDETGNKFNSVPFYVPIRVLKP